MKGYVEKSGKSNNIKLLSFKQDDIIVISAVCLKIDNGWEIYISGDNRSFKIIYNGIWNTNKILNLVKYNIKNNNEAKLIVFEKIFGRL